MNVKLAMLASTVVAAGMVSAGSAYAVVDLNFEGINKTYPSGYAFINGFYDGGTSSDGTTGTNYGISFSSNAQAICLNSTSVTCSNTSRGGLGDPNSQKGGLFFLSGSQTFMDVSGGFTTGFSFEHANISQAGSVSVYSGLDGTGTLLATLNFGTTPSGPCPGYNAGFCPFFASGIAFSGTALSVSFAGVANQVVFDDVTFGSTNPGNGVPEPATWALMLLGLAGVGATVRKTRRQQALA
jgi:hypothetical protein